MYFMDLAGVRRRGVPAEPKVSRWGLYYRTTGALGDPGWENVHCVPDFSYLMHGPVFLAMI